MEANTTWAEAQRRELELLNKIAALEKQLVGLSENAAKNRRVLRLEAVAPGDRERLEAAVGEEMARRSTLFDLAIPDGVRYLLVSRESNDVATDFSKLERLRQRMGQSVAHVNVPDGVEFTVLELVPPAR